jgi:ribosomal protein S18 acetylase RimI-like enzyme
MLSNLTVRAAKREDHDAFANIIDKNQMFPKEYLAEMMLPYLEDAACGDIWLCVANQDQAVLGFVYASPETMTNGTYNALLLAVDPDWHTKGLGKVLMTELEHTLKTKGHRVLVVETSSAPEQHKARSFYTKVGYQLSGVIPDFWDDGDDKLTYWKKLA